MLENREGQRVPQVQFQVRADGEWKTVTTDDLFKGKTVVVFSLPGAYTPTCSSTHLPRFEEMTPTLQANGVDAVYCVSVNDTFVMNEWAKEEGLEHVQVIPDGNGEFTAGMGMLVDKNDLGFGKRSWRYSMLVRDGIIEKMFIEPNVPGDPYEVSDADTMLDYLNPEAEKPADITVFTKPGCPFCARAKGMLAEFGYAYEEIELDRAVTIRSVRAITGRDTVPQVFVNGEHVGDSDAVQAWIARRHPQAA